MTARSRTSALLLLFALLAMGADSGGCTQNDGVGYKGRVTKRWQSEDNRYHLRIEDEQNGSTDFLVGKHKYDDCGPGEYYPGCWFAK